MDEMGLNIKIDKDLVAWIVDNVLGLVNYDSASRQLKARLEDHLRATVTEASKVHVVGMADPIPILDIYQPTRLRRTDLMTSHDRYEEFDFLHLLKLEKDIIIFAGPGYGKTTLMQWAFVVLSQDVALRKKLRPILFTLRRRSDPTLLAEFVERLKNSARGDFRGRIILLVDGYDEIRDSDESAKVRDALRQFSSLGRGNFYLTARTLYHVGDLRASSYEIVEFKRRDSVAYIRSFAKASRRRINAEGLLKELYGHGFEDFASNPLLLALVCIVKSGSSDPLPRNTIGLIKLAIRYLTYEWDMSKGVSRRTAIPLTIDQMIQCLELIAYNVRSREVAENTLLGITWEYLSLHQHDEINPRDVIVEMAKFFGLLVPASGDWWKFSHVTIQDYLAAKYWVEGGKFAHGFVGEWDARAAYATCLLSDVARVTGRVEEMLAARTDGFYAFTECLRNDANFDPNHVARAVVGYFERSNWCFEHKADDNGMTVRTNLDFFSLASDAFLDAMVHAGTSRRTPGCDVIAAFTFSEILRRGLELDDSLPGFDLLRVRYGSSNYEFKVGRSKLGWKTFRLTDLF